MTFSGHFPLFFKIRQIYQARNFWWVRLNLMKLSIKIPFFRVSFTIEPGRFLLQFVTTNCLTGLLLWAGSHRETLKLGGLHKKKGYFFCQISNAVILLNLSHGTSTPLTKAPQAAYTIPPEQLCVIRKRIYRDR